MNIHPANKRRRPLAAAVAACFALAALSPCVYAIDYVSNCNDTGSGSLRDTIANAASGDTVSLNQLTCSVISTGTAIEIPQAALTIKYTQANNRFTVTGLASQDRVFHHTGTGTLKIQGLQVKYGTLNATNASGDYDGGCIDSAGIVDLENSIVHNCKITGTAQFEAGGGVYARHGLILGNSTITKNSLKNSTGGAIGAGASTVDYLFAIYSTISGNTLGGFAGSSGSAISLGYTAQASKIDRCTISGNTGATSALYLYGGPTGMSMTIVNSTISGNTTSFPGAVDARAAALTIANSTIAFNQGSIAKLTGLFGNSYPASAGIYLENKAGRGSLTLQSSIIANNTATGYGRTYNLDFDSYAGTTLAGANNIVIAASARVGLPGDTITSDPLLLSLANNGGPTLTHAFRDGSPAFGRGNNVAGYPADQRGYPRITSDGIVDIGALQQQVRDVIFANSFD